MEGRDDSGDFKTARAKVYPPGLNAVLADAIHKFVCTTFEGSVTATEIPSDFYFFVTADFVPVDVVQPDYHG